MKGSRDGEEMSYGQVNDEHKADHAADFMDSIIRACCLCSSSLFLFLSRLGIVDRYTREREGSIAQHNLNLYRVRSVSWQDRFNSAIKAIVTKLDEVFSWVSNLLSPRLSDSRSPSFYAIIINFFSCNSTYVLCNPSLYDEGLMTKWCKVHAYDSIRIPRAMETKQRHATIMQLIAPNLVLTCTFSYILLCEYKWSCIELNDVRCSTASQPML